MQRCVMALSFALLAACGGGSGSSATASGGDVATSAAPAVTVVAPGATEAPAATPVAHLSGSIVKGPVTGAQVCVYELIATGKGKQLGCTTSRADGSYALSLEFAGEVVVEAVGGTYTDEATGLAGVPLSAPLISATKLGGGPSILHTTPLTALAYNQAIATGSGGLSLANFEVKASLVKDAFGLGADVDLKTTLPNVDVASANAYGRALRGVSRMLGMGASLAGVVGNPSLTQLKLGFEQVANCGVPPAIQSVPLEVEPVIDKSGYLFVYGGGSSSTTDLRFDVRYPDETWRALLSNESVPMGCAVSVNTAEQVVMQCPPAALGGHLTILSEQTSNSDVLSRGLPTNGVLVVGRFVTTYGKLIVAGDITLRAKNLHVNDSATLVSTSGSITMDTITGKYAPLITSVPVLADTKTYSGCNANSLDTTGNVLGVVPGGGSVSLVSSGFQTDKTPGKAISVGTIVFNNNNSGANYGSGITVQNTGTITLAPLSLSSSGQ